jgi:hypothetical protein
MIDRARAGTNPRNYNFNGIGSLAIPRFLDEPLLQTACRGFVNWKQSQFSQLNLPLRLLVPKSEQELEQARWHRIAKFLVGNELEHNADWKGLTLKSHNWLVNAALPVDKQDGRLTEGVPETIRDAMVGAVVHYVTEKPRGERNRRFQSEVQQCSIDGMAGARRRWKRMRLGFLNGLPSIPI